VVCNFFTWVRNPNGFDRYVGRRVGGGRKFLVCNICRFSFCGYRTTNLPDVLSILTVFFQ